MYDIKIGTMVGSIEAPETIRKIKRYGFETFAINFWQNLGGCDLKKLADDVKCSLEGCDAVISSIGVYGNSLSDPENLAGWKEIIENAHLFGTNIITGFAGGVVGESLENSLPRFKEVFTELGKMAEDKGLKIAIENCAMGGTWKSVTQNIAFSPDAWELMFNEVNMDNVGLQWEPCHQMYWLIDPMCQLNEKWIPKIINIHGKDAYIDRDCLAKHGVYGPKEWITSRTPGFGQCDWTEIIYRLRLHGYKGAIDIEGFHDSVYSGDMEYTGQVHALKYLKDCRGGEYR